MARLSRLALAGQAHHVVQRGHNHQAVFLDAVDRQAYVEALRESAATLRVAVHGYALLTERVELLVTPTQAEDLSRLLQALGRRYVIAFNRRHGRSGTLWEGRFRASVVEGGATLLQVLRCVEQAPLRAGLVAAPGDWPWSSAAHHLGRARDNWLTEPAVVWTLGNTPFERELAWQRQLEEPLDPAQVAWVTEGTLKGGVLGSGAFLAEVSTVAARPVLRRARGRPVGSKRVPAERG